MVWNRGRDERQRAARKRQNHTAEMSGSGRDEPRIDGERYIEKSITTPFINWIMDSADTDYADCSCPDGCQTDTD